MAGHAAFDPGGGRRGHHKVAYTSSGLLFTEDGPFVRDTVIHAYANGRQFGRTPSWGEQVRLFLAQLQAVLAVIDLLNLKSRIWSKR